jgi:two-component system, chemotaxis family, protein-glutamate methylesterase/glutaminase
MSVRVLIVDDTLLFRHLIGEVLQEIPDVEVVGSAGGGRMALARMESLRPDLVTLDIEMPDLSGIDVLREMRERRIGLSVVVLSGVTLRGGQLTMRALELGAFDFVSKPSEGTPRENRAALKAQLEKVIRAFGSRKSSKAPPPAQGALARYLRGPAGTPAASATPTIAPPRPAAPSAIARPNSTTVSRTGGPSPSVPGDRLDEVTRRMQRLVLRSRPELILIGVSTGGPNALGQLLPHLPRSLDVPILIVQHMPPLFTRSLAETLDPRCALRVKEAEPGEPVHANHVYIAPGGRQMGVVARAGGLVIEINDDPPENNCRPSVDYLFRSVAATGNGRVLAVILTGMGSDGVAGMRLLKQAGAMTVAQDEATSVVFGMPREAINAGVVDQVLPLGEIPSAITRMVREAA